MTCTCNCPWAVHAAGDICAIGVKYHFFYFFKTNNLFKFAGT